MMEIITAKILFQCFFFKTLTWENISEIETRYDSYLINHITRERVELIATVKVRESEEIIHICKETK